MHLSPISKLGYLSFKTGKTNAHKAFGGFEAELHKFNEQKHISTLEAS